MVKKIQEIGVYWHVTLAFSAFLQAQQIQAKGELNTHRKGKEKKMKHCFAEKRSFLFIFYYDL